MKSYIKLLTESTWGTHIRPYVLKYYSRRNVWLYIHLFSISHISQTYSKSYHTSLQSVFHSIVYRLIRWNWSIRKGVMVAIGAKEMFWGHSIIGSLIYIGTITNITYISLARPYDRATTVTPQEVSTSLVKVSTLILIINTRFVAEMWRRHVPNCRNARVTDHSLSLIHISEPTRPY